MKEFMEQGSPLRPDTTFNHRQEPSEISKELKTKKMPILDVCATCPIREGGLSPPLNLNGTPIVPFSNNSAIDLPNDWDPFKEENENMSDKVVKVMKKELKNLEPTNSLSVKNFFGRCIDQLSETLGKKMEIPEGVKDGVSEAFVTFMKSLKSVEEEHESIWKTHFRTCMDEMLQKTTVEKAFEEGKEKKPKKPLFGGIGGSEFMDNISEVIALFSNKEEQKEFVIV